MAKINVSVSSSSSKPNVTVSKGPVGPQGGQGIQGEAGPQGVEGTVSSVNDIPEFNVDLDTSNLGYDQVVPYSGALVNTISQRYLTWDPESNKIVLAEDANQGGYITGYVGQSSPRPSGQFVTGNVASTEGGSLDGIDTANGVVSINHSGQIDNSLNLYVNGDTRVNGVIQVGTDSTTSYSLPSADGTANQILKTDGSGATSFTSNYMDLDGAQVISGAKFFTATPVLTNGLQVNAGGINVTGASQLGSATFSGSLSAQQLTFVNNGTSIIAPTTSGGLLPEDLEVRSNGNILIKLDTDNNESAQKFIVVDYNDVERFSVQEDGVVRVSNAYNLPSADGTAGQFLKTDGSGNISFAAASSLALGTTSTTALAGDTTTISTAQASEITANTAKVGSQWTTATNDIHYTTGNVGIGTTSPSQALHVSGTDKHIYIEDGNLKLDRNNEGRIEFGLAGQMWGDSNANTLYLQKSGNDNRIDFHTQGGGFTARNTSTGKYFKVEPELFTVNNYGAFKYVQHNAANNNSGKVLEFSNGGASVNKGLVQINGDLKVNDYTTSSAVEKIKLGNDGKITVTHGSDAIAINGTAEQQGVAIGPTSKASIRSVAVGHGAGRFNGVADAENVFVGHSAGRLATSNKSVYVGYKSGEDNDGDQNVAIGYEALEADNSTASNTVAVGYQALTALTTGAGNTAVGYQAGDGITTANYNTVVGYSADVGTSHSSTIMGYDAGSAGTGVVAIGYQAQGGAVTNGFQNTGVGYQSNYQGPSEQNVSIGTKAGYS